MKGKTHILLLILFFLLSPHALASYSDAIYVPQSEVWDAAKKVLGQKSFKKDDPKKGELETNWIEDQVVRRRGLLKKIASKVYGRRYRIKLNLKQEKELTHVDIEGVFQEKSLDSVNSIWRKIKPESEDYEIERTLFKKILHQIEVNRNEPK